MGWFDEKFLLANCVWGSVAFGYLIYGWRQKSMVPFLGGLAMTVASCFIMSALLMSLASVAIMLAVWWLIKQGY